MADPTPGYSNWAGALSASTITTTGGTTQATGSAFIAVAVNRDAATGVLPTSVTDSFNNTYTLQKSISYGYSFAEIGLYTAIPGAAGYVGGGASHTCTGTWASSEFAIAIGFMEIENVGNGTVDVVPTGTFENASGNNNAIPPAITTTIPKEIVVNCYGSFSGQTITLTGGGAPFSIVVDQVTTGEINGAISFALPASTGAYNESYTWNNATDYWGALAISIKPAAAAPVSIAWVS